MPNLDAMIAEFKRRREAATQGEWETLGSSIVPSDDVQGHWEHDPPDWMELMNNGDDYPRMEADFAFITYAANHILPLLEAVEALLAERDRLAAEVEKYKDAGPTLAGAVEKCYARKAQLTALRQQLRDAKAAMQVGMRALVMVGNHVNNWPPENADHGMRVLPEVFYDVLDGRNSGNSNESPSVIFAIGKLINALSQIDGDARKDGAQ